MGSNCPYWSGGKCAPPGTAPDHGCSWPASNYQQCAMYKVVGARSAGGSMEDQMRAAGMIPPGATVVGGSGRRLSDRELGKLTSRKRWWQFWK